MDLKTTILMFALICALAAVFVLWAKWEEEKVKTKEERDRRFDEISRALSIEKELEQSKAREKCSEEAILWHAEKLIESYMHEEMLQGKLSALLCPRNDHVWKDGRCVKCGRVKDATN